MKPWLGYVAVGLFLLAGIFQFIGDKPLLGILFILVGAANLYIQNKFRKIRKNQK